MAVDRDLWAQKFVNALPHWPCPTCNKGFFAKSVEKFWIEETGPSKSARDHELWDTDWINKRFVGFLDCSMPACREIATVSGSSSIDYDQTGEDEHVEDIILNVEFISPSPIPISCPEQTPPLILSSVIKASSLIWMSPESSANLIRQAVECLMDEVGIPSVKSNGNPIKLHDRILSFQASDPENGDVLLATKWLGNSGSHVGGLSRDDVMDAFDMIEFVLENRYGTTKADLMAKVAAVNAAKGPA